MFEKNYMFQVPENKKVRVIVHADAKNEADASVCNRPSSDDPARNRNR